MNKTGVNFFLVLCALFIFLSPHVRAATTITARSCSQSAVQSAVGQALVGDTVVIPACSSTTWSGTVMVSLGITIQGHGQGSTTLHATNADLFSVTVPSGQTFRATGMTWTGMPAHEFMVISGDGATFRVDHVTASTASSEARLFDIGFPTMNDPTATDGISIKGVIDHCTLKYGAGSQAALIYGHSDSWDYPAGLGDGNAVYFEDNTISSPDGANNSVVDAECGAKLVFRYNSVINASNFEEHDTGSTTFCRATRRVEVYDNTFTTDSTMPEGTTWMGPRGGSGMIVFGNTVDMGGGSGTGYQYACGFEIKRLQSESSGALALCTGNREPFQGCTGSDAGWIAGNLPWPDACGQKDAKGNPVGICGDFYGWCGDSSGNPSSPPQHCDDSGRSGFSCPSGYTCHYECSPVGTFAGCGDNAKCVKLDGFQTSNGYPCRDQIGRGEDNPTTHVQASEPMYWWGNTQLHGGAAVEIGSTVGGPYQNYIKENRDYYDDDSTHGVTVASSLSSCPSTCTSGQACWVSGANTLYQCGSSNNWVSYYTPYTYPYSPQSAGAIVAPTDLRLGQ